MVLPTTEPRLWTIAVKYNGVFYYLDELTIDGISEETNDVDGSTAGRDSQAYTHRDKIAEKLKYNLAWKNIPLSHSDDMNILFGQDFFEAKINLNNVITKTFYAGARTRKFRSLVSGRERCDYSVNIVER